MSFGAFCKKLFGRFIAHRVSRSAAELTYYTLFSVFPMLIFLSSVIGRLNIPVNEVSDRLSVVLPENVVSLVTDYIAHTESMNRTFFLYAGSVLAVYMLYRAVSSLNYAVRKTIKSEDKRRFAHIILSVLICIALLLSIIILVVLLSFTETVFNYIGAALRLGRGLSVAANIIRYAAGPLMIFLVLWLYYYFETDRRLPFRKCACGAMFASGAWFLCSIVFSSYFDNFADVGLLYGSLGSIVVLLMWIHLTGTLFILGAEINALVCEDNVKR